MRSPIPAALAVMFSLSIASCDVPGVSRGPCTLVGCNGGITVQVKDVAGNRLSVFKGKALVGGEEITIDCQPETAAGSRGSLCEEGAVRLMLLRLDIPDTFELSLTNADETADFSGTVTVDPNPTLVYPNGKECDDTPCEQGTATVVLQ